MIKNCPAVDKLPGTAEMIKPGTDVGILPQAPSFKVLVPTIDGQEVVPPHGHVTTDDAPLGGIASDDGERQVKTFGSSGHIPGKEKSKTWDRLSRLKRFGS